MSRTSENKQEPTITIVGGGIAGLCAAVALRKAGVAVKVKVYEAASGNNPVGAGIMLGSNAGQALAHLGLWDELEGAGNIAHMIRICDYQGRAIQEMNNLRNRELYGFPTLMIHRADLQRVLLNHLGSDSPIFGKKIISAEQSSAKVKVRFQDETEIETDYLIAADGVHSRVRLGLSSVSEPRYAGYTCWRGVTDALPAGLDEKMFTETWGPNGRFGVAPLGNGKVYWFAVINAERNDPRMAAYGPSELLDAFRDYHFPVPDLIRGTPGDKILWNDIVDIKPIKRYAYDRIVLLGDAAHAVTPNMGQGAGQAIEGAVILAECMKHGATFQESFRSYEKAKLKKAHWVGNNSLRLGKIAQVSNPLLCSLRNLLFRMVPASSTEKNMRKLLSFELPEFSR